MSDGSKSGLSQLSSDINEAVVKPVSDEVGKALESAVTSVFGNSIPQQNIDPKVQAEKKQEEEKRKLQAIQTLNKWTQNLESDLQKVRQSKQQQEQQRLQKQQEEKKVKQFKVQEKKQKSNAALASKNTTESRKGVGG